MKLTGTSYRTLMLMTTLFVVLVIFQTNVRPPKLPVARARPVKAICPPEDPNRVQEKAPLPQPAVAVVAAEEAAPVWIEDEPQGPEDPNELDDAPAAIPE